MKKLDLGQTIGIVANLGVIAGIAFLAIELRQNNELMDTEIRMFRQTMLGEVAGIVIENPEFADLLVRANNNEELTAAEGMRVGAYINKVFRNHEFQYGELTGDLPESTVSTWRRNAGDTRGRLWERLKSNYDPDFVEFYEENVLGER